MTLKLSDTMHDADFVVIDGVVFETEYVRVPDEFTVADDVVLEARHGETELAFTQADFEDAEHVARRLLPPRRRASAALPDQRDGPLTASLQR